MFSYYCMHHVCHLASAQVEDVEPDDDGHFPRVLQGIIFKFHTCIKPPTQLR